MQTEAPVGRSDGPSENHDPESMDEREREQESRTYALPIFEELLVVRLPSSFSRD